MTKPRATRHLNPCSGRARPYWTGLSRRLGSYLLNSRLQVRVLQGHQTSIAAGRPDKRGHPRGPSSLSQSLHSAQRHE